MSPWGSPAVSTASLPGMPSPASTTIPDTIEIGKNSIGESPRENKPLPTPLKIVKPQTRTASPAVLGGPGAQSAPRLCRTVAEPAAASRRTPAGLRTHRRSRRSAARSRRCSPTTGPPASRRAPVPAPAFRAPPAGRCADPRRRRGVDPDKRPTGHSCASGRTGKLHRSRAKMKEPEMPEINLSSQRSAAGSGL